MRPRLLVSALALVASAGLGAMCPPKPIVSVSPADGSTVTTMSFDVDVQLSSTANVATLEVTLNGTPLVLTGGPSLFTAALVPGSPLRDDNTLVVTVEHISNGTTWTRTHDFQYLFPGKAHAKEITQASELITGPIGHSRLGDWLLENDGARFVVQDVGQRDLHSVGEYGGNLIDAEVVGRPGRDNFFEIQPTLNIETVINAQTVEIVNDGEDGTAAIVRTCGPDDLMNYVNASSRISDLGVSVPNAAAIFDDRDLPMTGCTEYRLAPGKMYVEMETTVFNESPDPESIYIGEFVNGMGTLEQWVRTAGGPNAGPGETLVAAAANLLAFRGYDTEEGIDYGIIPKTITEIAPPSGSSSFTDSGVSYILHSHSVVFVLGFDAPPLFEVPGNGSNSFTAYFSVGDGSFHNVTAIEAEVREFTTGTLQGCVTVGGVPAPGARVSVGPIVPATGRIRTVENNFTTDAAGCYQGTMRSGTWGVAAAKNGVPYQGGGTLPVVTSTVIPEDGVAVRDVALPATGHVHVEVTDHTGSPLPARISVVGFDPSPEPIIVAAVLAAGDTRTGTFYDVTRDATPAGMARTAWTGASGEVDFDLEPGSYQLYVSRGTEYSLYSTPITSVANSTSNVSAQIAPVLDTAGYISSDYHVHMAPSPDSRISLPTRAISFAAEGVDNLIATDHDAITDLTPTIVSLGLGPWLHSTIGEEITSFDYGHFNAYPQAVDPSKPSGGSTDWGLAAPPGEDFPSQGHYSGTPAQIDAAAVGKPQNAGLETVVQVNHIGSHFSPLQIDTSEEPPQSFLPDPAFFRLDPGVANFFHPFQALELWNGSNNTHQSQFLNERIGIWMNLLNQGILATAISDTDTHSAVDLETAGARTWTPSSTDAPAGISDNEVGLAVKAHKAVGGQGAYLQTRLVEGASVADFSLNGTTLVTATDGSVDLEIEVQSPIWAPYDRIEIYRNAQTVVTGTTGGTPTSFSANPTMVLTLGGGGFTRSTVNVHPSVAGASRYETSLTVPLSGLTQDEWVVVIVKGTSGTSEPMFPVYPRNLDTASNTTLAALTTILPTEAGVRALAHTNALFVDVDGNGDYDPPGVQLAP